MHEASIAQSIVNAVLENAQKNNAVRVENVELEVGELTFLNIEQVLFWIEVGFENTIAEGAKIKTTRIDVKISCSQCHYTGPVSMKNQPYSHYQVPVIACSRCGDLNVEVTEGKDVLIRRLQIVRANEED
jgi:hydrogenase nickel incorporation protein HypA/HybF